MTNNIQATSQALVEFQDAHVATRDAAIVSYRDALVNNIDVRGEYEFNKSPDNDSIQSKLKGFAKIASHLDIASVMFASNVDVNRINRSERVGARYNVYAFEKDLNLARSLAGSDSLNHYTLHVFLTAFALFNAGIALTHEHAFAACLKGSKVKNAQANKLISRYERIEVSKGTASTQSSSSVNALQAFDVLRETRNSEGETAYTLNFDSKATQKLLALYCANK